MLSPVQGYRQLTANPIRRACRCPAVLPSSIQPLSIPHPSLRPCGLPSAAANPPPPLHPPPFSQLPYPSPCPPAAASLAAASAFRCCSASTRPKASSSTMPAMKKSTVMAFRWSATGGCSGQVRGDRERWCTVGAVMGGRAQAELQMSNLQMKYCKCGRAASATASQASRHAHYTAAGWQHRLRRRAHMRRLRWPPPPPPRRPLPTLGCRGRPRTERERPG